MKRLNLYVFLCCAVMGLCSRLCAQPTTSVYTLIPDPKFEQALIDLGMDSGLIDGKVMTDKIRTVQDLDIRNKGISNLQGIEEFYALKRLNCYGNQISSLNLAKNPELHSIICGYNQLTSLDVSANFKLSTLFCKSNNLTSLVTDNNHRLQFMDCSKNKLNSLDVRGTTGLLWLICTDNTPGMCIAVNSDQLLRANQHWTKDHTATFSTMPCGQIPYSCTGLPYFKGQVIDGFQIVSSQSNRRLVPSGPNSGDPIQLGPVYDPAATGTYGFSIINAGTVNSPSGYPTGTYPVYKFVYNNTGDLNNSLYLNVDGGGRTDDARALILWRGNGIGNNERFFLMPTGKVDEYTINPVIGKALDVYGQGTAPGTPVILWPFNGQNNQKFILKRVCSGSASSLSALSVKVSTDEPRSLPVDKTSTTLLVSPNPATGNTIKISGVLSGTVSNALIYTGNGQVISKPVFNNTVAIGDLPNGYYTIRVISNGKVLSANFIK